MNIITKNSPNFNQRPDNTVIDTIILHYTGMQSAAAAIERMCDAQHQVSAHYCIDLNGDVIQLVDDNNRAWHAGKSYWKGVENLNNNSIGIEIVNYGHEFGYQAFPEVQTNAVIELVSNLFKLHPIKKNLVIGHSDIAPDRKEDPGELFNWQSLAAANISIWHGLSNDDFSDTDYQINFGESGSNIKLLQQKLEEFGYKIELTESFDIQTKQVIAAFYRRFIPTRIINNANTRYPENIFWDNEAEEALDILLKL